MNDPIYGGSRTVYAASSVATEERKAMTEHTFEAFYEAPRTQGNIDALIAIATHCPQADFADLAQGVIRAIAASAYQQGQVDLLLEKQEQ